MFTKLLQKYMKAGWFDNYPMRHILYPAIVDKNVQLEEYNNELIYGIKRSYGIFKYNFLKTLLYMNANLDDNSNEWIVKHYLACENNYTDKEFLVRYSTVLIMCGLKVFNYNIQQCNLQIIDDSSILYLKFNDGRILRLYSGVLSRDNIRKMLDQQNVLELEVGLKSKDIKELQKWAHNKNIYLIPPCLQQIVDEINKINYMPEDEKIYDVCILHLISDDICVNNIFSVKGMLLNQNTGIFLNDILHEEYHYDISASKRINGMLVIKHNVEFFVYGDIRYLLDEEHHFFSVNEIGSKSWLELYPFVRSNISEKIFGIYNPTSKDINEYFNFYIALTLENYKEPLSAVFTNREVLFLQNQIRKNLIEESQLLLPFGLNIQEAIEEIYKRYELMYEIIRNKYPDNHPFRSDRFLFDAMSFSLAYCMYVVPVYLNNSDMIEDFLQKKLVCKKDGLFNRKVFNENYSEFEIFFYLFVGIFCKSERYKTFLRLEYEPDGNQNKRFEYAFIFKEYKLNIEVKALECAPEDADNISLATMKNGTRFYKNYFHAYEEKEIIPTEVLNNAKRLKSNYRQISKNIKKIQEKCVEEDKVINLGFLMINYGTSREEFISYLMNYKQGYLRKNPLDKLDALVLFSMCMDTDLLMERILEKEHIFVFTNVKKENGMLLADLRLNNYVSEKEDNRYALFFNDMYGQYIGIHSNGIVTIQREDVTEKDWKREQDILNRIDDILQELVELGK